MKKSKELEQLYRAWTDMGINPFYHKRQIGRLKTEWRPLYDAMVKFIKEYKNEKER